MSADNRDFFRLEDDIRISFKVVTATDAKTHDANDFFPASTAFQLSSDIYALEMESAEILRNVHDQNRQLAGLLANINKRIELLSRSLISSHEDEFMLEHSHCEISEGGLSFTTQNLIHEGDVLALRLIFQPSLLCLACFAEVKHCHEVSAALGYRIGTRFIEMDQSSQRLVARHIMTRQAEDRRLRRARQTSD